MYICIYTKTRFKEASGEHVMQNFLGARWTDGTIVCDDLQQKFGDTIDREFAKSMEGYRTLLGTKGGRGGTPPPIKSVKNSEGKDYNLTFGGKPELAKPIINIQKREDGSAEVHIQLGHQNQMGWALHILKKEHPELKIDNSSIEGNSNKSQEYLKSPLTLQFGIGGPDFFRGVCKAIFNLLGVSRPDVALNTGLDPVRSFIVDGEGDSSDFIGWVTSHDPIPLPRLGSHDHFMAVWATTGTVTGVLQLFGEIPFIVQLGVDVQCDDFSYSYLVNPHRDTDPAEIRNGPFSTTNIPKFDECPHLPGPEVWSAQKVRVGRLMSEYMNRANEKVVGDIFRDVMAEKNGEVPTQEDVDKISERLIDFFESKLNLDDQDQSPKSRSRTTPSGAPILKRSAKKMSENTSPAADEITVLAGRALFLCQFVEHNLSMLCRMFKTDADVEPKQDPNLFGIAKERTASLQRIKRALKEFGIDANHYLLPEIEDFVTRRDWLAHRVFIETKESTELTRAFQKSSLDGLIVRAHRLLSVILAVSKRVAENLADAEPLPDDHVISRLCRPYQKESDEILNAMITRTPIPPPTTA